MSGFRRNNNAPITGPIDLVNGNSLRLKINGISEGAKARHLTVSSSCPTIVIEQNPDERKSEQTVVVHVAEVGSTCLATISAIDPKNGHQVAAIRINVLPKLALPDIESDEGMVARLLLAESLSPSFRAKYDDGQDVLRAMGLMREVLDNRLVAAKSSSALRSLVVCNPATDDLKGVVLATRCGGARLCSSKDFLVRALIWRKCKPLTA